MSAVPLILETGELTREQNLFSLGQELEQIFDSYCVIAEGEDLAAADAFLLPALEEYFNAKANQLDDKIDAYCAVLDKRKAYLAYRESEAKRYAALARTDKHLIERLKARLQAFMHAFGYTRLETKSRKVWVQLNGGEPGLEYLRKQAGILEAIPEPDLSLIPKKYIRMVPQVDTDLIRQDLKAGKKLRFARFAQIGTHLRTK